LWAKKLITFIQLTLTIYWDVQISQGPEHLLTFYDLVG